MCEYLFVERRLRRLLKLYYNILELSRPNRLSPNLYNYRDLYLTNNLLQIFLILLYICLIRHTCKRILNDITYVFY